MESNNLPFVNTLETIGKPPSVIEADQKLRAMADAILRKTTCCFINTKTGELFTESEDLPVSADIRLQSGYNDWKYWNGVIHLALIELGYLLDEKKYIDYVVRNYEFAFKHISYFRKLFEAEVENANFHQFFRLDRLDDFGALAAGLIQALPHSEIREEYNEYLANVTVYISNKQDRLEDGLFCRRRFGKTTVWGDDLYMSVPFLVNLWRLTKEETFMSEAIKQVKLFHRYLYREANGLFYHCWYKELNQHGVAHWGRANGWMLMGQCELLKHLPVDHPERETLIGLYLRQVAGISRYQTANGMWRQLIDKPDSFLESSSTAMFVYGIAAAVNRGWIDDMYASIAVKGWQALTQCIDENGELDLVSTGFNIKQDLAFYYNRPIEKGGDHGLGAAILAGIEIAKIREYRDCVWC